MNSLKRHKMYIADEKDRKRLSPAPVRGDIPTFSLLELPDAEGKKGHGLLVPEQLRAPRRNLGGKKKQERAQRSEKTKKMVIGGSSTANNPERSTLG